MINKTAVLHAITSAFGDAEGEKLINTNKRSGIISLDLIFPNRAKLPHKNGCRNNTKVK